MLFEQLQQQKSEIESLAQSYGAFGIQVFGSVARHEDKPDSDIDFLVDFPVGYNLFTQRLPLTKKLEELTGRKIDLIPIHELNKHIRSAVMQEATYL